MDKVEETAAAGSTGAHSIAVVPGNRLGGMQTRMTMKEFMLKFHSGIANRYRFQPVATEGSIGSFEKITESSGYPDQLQAVTSRLKDLQTTGEYDSKDIISYGVRDDTGNMMIITIPLEQSEEFEQRVAQTLSDVLDFKKTGKGEDKSLAELLYELKDEFTIVQAEFPKLPKDAVYNADEITEADPEAGLDGEEGDDEFGDEEGDDELGGDDGSGDPESGMGGDSLDLDDEDEDMGDDFEGGDSKEDLMVSVLGMLKSQNEKETAQANAAAEEARAKQAEIAMKSSKSTVAKEEELIVAQAEMDAVKDKEKRVKKMTDLATFNYKKKMGLREGFSELFTSIILELDANDTPITLRRQMTSIRTKYKVDPNDDLETKQFKQKQAQHERKELQVRMRAARNRTDFEDDMDDKEREELEIDQEQERQDQENDRGQLR